MDRAQEVGNFKRRIFSGYDLLQFMDEVGVGVGATMQIVQEAERKHERHPETYRALDGITLISDALFDEAARFAGKGTPEGVVYAQPLFYAREFLIGEFG